VTFFEQLTDQPIRFESNMFEFRSHPDDTAYQNGPCHKFMADFSLALINRTGAYHLSHDLLTRLPGFFIGTRYWRLVLPRQPRGIVRRLLSRMMLWDLVRLSRQESEDGRKVRIKPPTLFLDPLYVISAGVSREDIVLCHDLGPLSHPLLYHETTTQMYEYAYNRIARARPGIVFVSEASRQEFTGRFGNDFRFLTVIPLYVRHGVDAKGDMAPRGVRKPFLLTIGALEIRKNYPRSIMAFQRSGLAERGYTYVLCGPRGNCAERIRALAMGTPGVQCLGYRSDLEVRWLYRNASGFVLPSLLEGFGMPGLEAAQHGLVSLVSAGTAQEEAVAGAAVLVDPSSEASIASGMLELVDMPEEKRRAISARAAERAQELSLDAFLNRWSAVLQQA
jgi:glycosyltransferase involved in cell wall biosynthesis